MTCNGKGEVIVVHTMTAYWGMKVQLHSFLTTALGGGSTTTLNPTPIAWEDRWIIVPVWTL